MMKSRDIVLAFAVALLIASCKPGNKPVDAGKVNVAELITAVNKGNITYADYFLDKTMRLDYFHSGTSAEEHFAVDRIVSDGMWSGSKTILIDDLQLGL